METPTIDAASLRSRLAEGGAFVLLDVLPGDTWNEIRIPGSVNACVYDVTFIDQVAALGIERTTEIVVYCSRASCRASLDAVDRLMRNGFESVVRFVGGREAWGEAGYAFEGEGELDAWRPGPGMAIADGAYAVDLGESRLEWTGRNAANRHFGTMRFAGGSLVVRGGFPVEGTIDIDMRSMEAGDLDGEMAGLLVAHLESEDFFAADRFPLASVVLRRVRGRRRAPAGSPNCEVMGELTLRGETGDVALEATVAPHGEGALVVQGHLDMDRTRWGATYGSGRLYDRLGMHLVNDLVTIAVTLVAHPDPR